MGETQITASRTNFDPGLFQFCFLKNVWVYFKLSLLLHPCGGAPIEVSTLATHASGPGSIAVAGGKKERLISLLLNIRGCAPRGSHIT